MSAAVRSSAGGRHARRVDSITQLTSQVSPPSVEKACSQRQVVAVMSDQRKRTRIGRPLNVSSATNVPMPSEKPPTTGGSRRLGSRPSSHQIDQRSDDRVERPQRNRPIGAGRQLEDVVVDVAGAAEDRPGLRRALELLPLVASREPLLQPAVMDPPFAHVKVEVVDGRAGFGRPRGNAGSSARSHRCLLQVRDVQPSCIRWTCHGLSGFGD